ncbi:MAG TPA: hypothetical protein VK869_07970 [Rubrobacteraceae bacterium]|nr:hypothetical protein [Rubrobacteraceae bacterium]
MSFGDGKLYDLMPAVHRLRDAEGRLEGLDGDLPLRSLLSIVAREVAVVEEDLAQLYDDLFIETCAEWVVPYIGDLVGVGGLHDLQGAASRRAQVANTVAYRRRKGTVAVLEGLARDATGWPAHATEFFEALATTQRVNHVRLSNLYSPDLRRWEPLEFVDTPFDELAYTADVRRIASRRGRHNIPNVGIFLWRLHPYELRRSPAVRLDGHRYLFNPLGTDAQLFTKPEPESDIAHLSRPIDVPLPISRRLLRELLSEYYGPDKSIYVEVDGDEKDPGVVIACNLDDVPGDGWAHTPPEGKIAIDPVLGRIAFPDALAETASVLVTYHYGFSTDMGGGEYDRAASLGAGTARRVSAADLEDIAAGDGIVEISDSGRYEGTLEIDAGGSHVELRAADGRRPILDLEGALEIKGQAGAEVTLNGLLISGGALKVSGDLRRLRLVHCTLVPGIQFTPDGAPERGSEPSLCIGGVEVEIDRCILGGLRIQAGGAVRITDSVLDATDTNNVAYAAANGPGGRLRIENSTVIGSVNTEVLELASNTIFLGRVTARRKQEGCVRFSFLPLDSEVPRKHRCHPRSQSEARRVRPQFTSLRYGDPGYCQLGRYCAAEIRRGADDESEMGAFHDLFAPQREANLRARLDEYLRFGLEAGVLYAT